MRVTLATLCMFGVLTACERRTDRDAAADLDRPAADTAIPPAVAVDTAPRDTLDWKPAPPSLPAGARAVVLAGDPTKTGPFTLRLEMPPGYEVKPHHHPTSENVKVIEGTLMVGHGKSWADSALKALTVGQEGSIPAKQPHYVRAKEKTVLDVRSTGPFVITYENPADDPRSKAIP